jgi:hypothetical protein
MKPGINHCRCARVDTYCIRVSLQPRKTLCEIRTVIGLSNDEQEVDAGTMSRTKAIFAYSLRLQPVPAWPMVQKPECKLRPPPDPARLTLTPHVRKPLQRTLDRLGVLQHIV